jgi:CBS domain containing-hemolysin-like protein
MNDSATLTALLSAAPLGVALLLCLALRAFFAGSETALVSLDRVQVQKLTEEGDRRARIVAGLIGNPDRMLAMTLAGTNLMSVLVAQIVLALMIVLLAGASNAPLIATATTTVLVLIFGEILPKTIFRLRALDLALRYATLLRFFDIALGFGVRLIGVLTGAIVRLLGRRMEPASPDSIRAELRLLATLGEKSGGIPREQRRMIHGVLDLAGRRVGRVMVPLVNIVAVNIETGLAEFLEIAAASGFSRIPVFKDRIYNIVGIVHIMDVLDAGPTGGTIEPFIRRNVRFVPESQNVHSLLREIQTGPHTMVFAVDEHGGTTGLVTVADLVEEVFKELADERVEAESVRRIGPRLIECDGRTEAYRLVEEFGIPVPEGDYETIAGFVLERAGTIPRPGDQVETDDFIVTVAESDAKAIRRVRIRSKTDPISADLDEDPMRLGE